MKKIQILHCASDKYLKQQGLILKLTYYWAKIKFTFAQVEVTIQTS